MSLEFFVSHKGSLAVIALKGELHETDTQDALQRCIEETIKQSPQGVVLHLAELSSLPANAFRAFSLFLKGIKGTNTLVRVSSPNSTIREDLIQAGIFSTAEIKSSLPEAIKSLAEHLKALQQPA